MFKPAFYPLLHLTLNYSSIFDLHLATISKSVTNSPMSILKVQSSLEDSGETNFSIFYIKHLVLFIYSLKFFNILDFPLLTFLSLFVHFSRFIYH